MRHAYAPAPLKKSEFLMKVLGLLTYGSNTGTSSIGRSHRVAPEQETDEAAAMANIESLMRTVRKDAIAQRELFEVRALLADHGRPCDLCDRCDRSMDMVVTLSSGGMRL